MVKSKGIRATVLHRLRGNSLHKGLKMPEYSTHNLGHDACIFKRTVAILTVSDRGSKGERHDASGAALEARLRSDGYHVAHRSIVPDEVAAISEALRSYCDDTRVAMVVTTGGTGVAPRDVTPEATLAILDRQIPGMAEAMRSASLRKTPHAMISRAVVGVRGRTLIVNLPGSPKGAVENLEVLLPAVPHALDKIQGDTSDCADAHK